jgi:ferredoxin
MQVSPKISIDRTLCTTPFDCKRCLRACPPAVFGVVTLKSLRGVETDKKEPGAYVLVVSYRDKCTGCLKCVEVCQSGALKVTMPEEVPA